MSSESRLSNPYCRPRLDPLDERASPRQRGRWAQLGGALAAGAPLVVLSLWMYVVRGRPLTLTEMLGGPLLVGGALIVWILLVHKRLCGDRFSSLGLKTDRVWIEALLGLALAGVLLTLHHVTGPVLTRLFPPQPPPREMLDLLHGLSRSPALLALWLGPVVWIGIAGFEELWRVHLLRRLWRIWPGPLGRWIVVAASAGLVAGVHLYQPPAVMLSIGLLSLLKGAFYLLTGRFWALVVAHALYDSVQVVAIVIAIRQG